MDTSGLQTLPREILLNLQNHLPPSSKVLLNYVSHHFYRSFDYNMDNFFREHGYPKYKGCGWSAEQASEARKNRPQRLELLCLLERDHLIRQSRAVCSVCCAIHKDFFFQGTELQKDCTLRRCLGHMVVPELSSSDMKECHGRLLELIGRRMLLVTFSSQL
ncbi:hypothetical protein N7G274_002259 [Stereocaulon virgatum]|uniref:F-box domain-containing protein n=1 Tax=Stereocaulon virgatum TaxID=373712 RepID=A0ABR4AHC2_9LECA